MVTSLAATRQTAVAAPPVSDELLETIPSLPTLEGFSSRLSGIQDALDEARMEAEALRDELRQKANMLRALAGALESV